MAAASPVSFSSSFIPFPWKDSHIADVRPSRICFCAVRSPPTRKSSSASSSPPRVSLPPKKAPPANSPSSPPKKRHWKMGEFPGVSESSIAGSIRSPIKNVKKKIDDRASARAWACTVTEALSDRVQKKQWQEALEVACIAGRNIEQLIFLVVHK